MVELAVDTLGLYAERHVTYLFSVWIRYNQTLISDKYFLVIELAVEALERHAERHVMYLYTLKACANFFFSDRCPIIIAYRDAKIT